MKLKINISSFNRIVALLCIMLLVTTISAQDEPFTTRMDLSCEQASETEITLVAQGRYKEGRSYTPLINQEFEFFAYIDGEETVLGNASTDESGYARYSIDNLDGWDVDEEGYYTFGINYAGTDEYEDNFDETVFKRARVDVTTEDGEEKSVTVQLFELGQDGEIPVEDIEIAVAVPMMFSDLIIGSDYTDSDGMVSFTFPDDLPGDEIGNIKFIAKTIDADDYGVVLQSVDQQWGVPKAQVIEQTRSLWTPNAPMWMVITFTLLMLAVWGHFVYIIMKLINVKNQANPDPA